MSDVPSTDEILSQTEKVFPLPGEEGYDPVVDRLDPVYTRYYSREGEPITFREWVKIISWNNGNENAYKRVASDEVGPYWVSTVWLGLDHSFGEGPPLIFETMVFKRDEDGDIDFGDLDMDRYSTLADAVEGHQRMVDKVRLLHEAFEEETGE